MVNFITKKAVAIVFRCTADYSFTVANMIVGIERFSPNLATDYIIYTDDNTDKRLTQIREIVVYYGKSISIYRYDYTKVEYVYNYHPSFVKRYPLIVFSIFEIFNLLDLYENVIALDSDMIVQKPFDSILNIKLSFASRPARKIKDVMDNYNGNNESPNAGFIYINDKLNNYTSMTERCYQLLKDNVKNIKYTMEECILGLLLEELGIKPDRSISTYNKHPQDYDAIHAHIIHFLNIEKPWKSLNTLRMFPLYLKNAIKVKTITSNKYDNITCSEPYYRESIRRDFCIEFNKQLYEKILKSIDRNLYPKLNIEQSRLSFLIRINEKIFLPSDVYIGITYSIKRVIAAKNSFEESYKNANINHFNIILYISRKNNFLVQNINSSLKKENATYITLEKEVVTLDDVKETVNGFCYNVSKVINQYDFIFRTARIDLKNINVHNSDIDVILHEDRSIILRRPKWFKDNSGIGYSIETYTEDGNGVLNFRSICKNDGEFTIFLKTLDIRTVDNKRINFLIVYKDLIIDGEKIITFPISVSHDAPFVHKIPAKKGQSFEVHLAWEQYSYTGKDYLAILERLQSSSVSLYRNRFSIE